MQNAPQGRERFECKQHLRSLEDQARPLLVSRTRRAVIFLYLWGYVCIWVFNLLHVHIDSTVLIQLAS